VVEFLEYRLYGAVGIVQRRVIRAADDLAGILDEIGRGESREVDVFERPPHVRGRRSRDVEVRTSGFRRHEMRRQIGEFRPPESIQHRENVSPPTMCEGGEDLVPVGFGDGPRVYSHGRPFRGEGEVDPP
jgi:hypothetical protein